MTTGSPGRPARWADAAPAIVAGLLALAVYLFSLAPTVSGEDSGELITAACTFGVPHPPGYPLWCLCGNLFSMLPIGNPAWRVNLSSAIFAAGAVGVTALLILRICRSRIAAFSGALALALSREFWEQAVIAEVYALNALLVALCVWLLWLWHDKKKRRYLYAFAAVYGISLTNHNTMVLLGPLFALFVLAVDGVRPFQWRPYAIALFLATLGLTLYAYLPLTSLRNPPMDWGNPETLRDWWMHVSRKQFAFMFSQYPRSPERFLYQLAACAHMWTFEFTPFIAPVALAGLLLFFVRRRMYALFTLALACIVVAGFAFIQNFNFDREWLWVMSVFGIPAYLMTALWIGVAIDAAHQRAGTWAAAALGVACVFLPLVSHWETNNKSNYYWTADYAENVLAQMAPDAVYISEADHASFPAVYLQAVEGARPDVLIARKYGYLAPELLALIPERRRAAEWGDKPFRRYEPAIFAALLEQTQRPVYFTNPPTLPEPASWRFDQEGLLFRAVRKNAPHAPRLVWDQYTWRNGMDPAQTYGDQTAEIIIYEYHMAHAREDFSNGLRQSALRHVETAVRVFGPDSPILNNAGALCARFGEWDAAGRYLREALRLDPANTTAAENLERLYRLGNVSTP